MSTFEVKLQNLFTMIHEYTINMSRSEKQRFLCKVITHVKLMYKDEESESDENNSEDDMKSIRSRLLN